MLDGLKLVHDSGYVYNDLKLDNCVVGNTGERLEDIRIIDFGLAKKYTDLNGVHLPEQNTSTFSGNLMFSTHHTQNLRSSSRRDDLISLCYLLIYSLEGNLPWLETDERFSEFEEFHLVKSMKENASAESLCNTPDSSHLMAFVREIFKLKFEENPDYQNLKQLLVSQLVDINEAPNANQSI